MSLSNSNRLVCDPLAFWYAHCGQYYIPAEAVPLPIGTRCDVTDRDDLVCFDTGTKVLSGAIWSLSKAHPHALGRTAMRLGGAAKAVALVCPHNTIVMADVLPSRSTPADFVQKDTAWRTAPNWIAEIFEQPPPPPFLFIVFGRSPYLQHTFKVTVDPRLVHICGVEATTADTAKIHHALRVIEGLPGNAWRQVAHINHDRHAQKLSELQANARLETLEKKYQGISQIVDGLPQPGTAEFDALSLIVAQREKAEKDHKL